MKALKILLAMTMILALATVSFAEEAEKKLAPGEEDFIPTTSVFHLDVRALSVFDLNATGLVRNEDPEDEYGIGSSFAGLGSGVGVKLGYLIDGHHDVGGHLQYSNTTVRTYFNPEDEREDEVEILSNAGSFRAAAYYNYNWNVKGWVMPYVGPVLGIDAEYARSQDMDDDDSKVTSAMITPFLGVEGGVKLFPMKNVAFDMAVTSTAGPTVYATRYADDRDDDTFGGASFNLAFNAGLCVYFE